MKIKRQDTSIPVFSYVMDIFLFSHPLQLLITQHSLVQFFLHPVNEIGAAFVLPAFLLLRLSFFFPGTSRIFSMKTCR